MVQEILQRFIDAYRQPGEVADGQRLTGRRIARVLGVDVPHEVIAAAGFVPIRLAADRAMATPRADALMGTTELSPRSRSLLEALLQVPASDLIVISHAEAQFPQLFAILREAASLNEAPMGPVQFLDLKHLPRASTERYNRLRLGEWRTSLDRFSGSASGDDALRQALSEADEHRQQLKHVMTLRAGECRLNGAEALAIIGSAAILPEAEHLELLRQLISRSSALSVRTGRRVFVTGSSHEDSSIYERLESCGLLVVGEDHDWGDPWYVRDVTHTGDPLSTLVSPTRHVPMVGQSVTQRTRSLSTGIARVRPELVVHVCMPGDEAAPWDTNTVRSACDRAGVPLLVLEPSHFDGEGALQAEVRRFLEPKRQDVKPGPHLQSASAKKSSPATGERSRKSLQSVAAFGDYQRTWFADLRRRVDAGEPLAVVNANAPQEILRALDIPFVVNQWWASIVAAKQQSRRYLDLLRERGFPVEIDAYSSQGLAAVFDADPEDAPWGGLPTPTFLQAINGTDGAARLFEAWAQASGAELFLFERTIDARWSLFQRWWESLPTQWNEVLEPERLDLLVAEMRELIANLERRTGRTFSHGKFAHVMTLVNEQEEYYRRTRDLIARTVPAPAGIADTMPATMTPQWHRGTEWARDAARAFYEEVAGRVQRGEAACANERVRLMWVGRGMWSEMGFYQRWEASHGAVFVWSMYLALAADGYIRTFDGGRDPLRALAARVVTMGDELRMPTWAAAWHVNEARTHSVDGAVALADADPFVLRALEQSGIPVLALPLDNFNKEGADRDAIERSVTQFIEGPVEARARMRAAAG
ncbi:benzoyl-CoA reductase/2-hydroxyglutaryl-CoA dehydratase subunit BcrC/BadD/HgdB [Povalibacter uvarum]|uniref:Benzoyl-CoA reductase/2-hydroxyglutaryl-CoA dehydratase subunit BcrC/BadD/HgdB n=1 Tax=Povalibacter uvarum TaxID=732238 RepID=A0A841HLQ6_9GAMM|nr:2-hydroxyacyl-CoA dehydratase family protein [Povalibacter uvarum]MBB6093806.1 benzoyl-CoA reductase/2-hydroxyglutaryl-CoA dehydratase subunit BcrC/BadD/HgdB [Povalibacter uvarum]